MYFSHAFRRTLLGAATTQGGSTLNATGATSTATSALTAGQLGIYNRNYGYIDYTGTGTTAPFYIVQGSYYKQTGYSDTIGAHGGYQESVKSKLINPRFISRIFWVQAKAPVQQVVQIPLKAQSGSTNVGLTADTTYRLRIDVKGSPALRFLSHNIYRNLDSYTGPANATTSGLLKDPVATLVDWKEQLTMSPYFNQLVQARAYALKVSTASTSSDAVYSGTNYAIYASSSYSDIYVGQRVINSTDTTKLPVNSFVTNVANITTRTASSPTGTATTTSFTVTGGGALSGAAAVGAYAYGIGLPSGSYISSYTSTSSYTISYPVQTTAPTITASTLTVTSAVIVSYPTQATAPAVANFNNQTFKYYNDLYGANGGYTVPYTNIAVTSGQQPTYVGQTPYIPGSSAYSTNTGTYPGLAQTSGTATGATIAATSTVAAATSGAHIYTPSSDASTFTQTAVGVDAFLELTAAYLETKFGNPTFTVTDNYDLEPLKIIASLMDDSGNTTVTAPIGSAAATNALSIGEAGIATVVQAAQQAQGVGETVLRDLILTGRYRQEAFGDGTNVDQIRMRETEANPGVLNMTTVANRNTLFHKLCILHNVPRFNNPTTTFDNDQYLIEIAVPSTIPLSEFITGSATNGIIASSGNMGSKFGDYIAEAAFTAGGAQFIEVI